MRSYDCCNLTTALLNFDYNVMIVSLTFGPLRRPSKILFLIVLERRRSFSTRLPCCWKMQYSCHNHQVSLLLDIVRVYPWDIRKESDYLFDWVALSHTFLAWLDLISSPFVILTRQTHLRVYSYLQFLQRRKLQQHIFLHCRISWITRGVKIDCSPPFYFRT